ncbi:MAG: FAD-binding domain-containing protein [Pseudomonadota bacterium]
MPLSQTQPDLLDDVAGPSTADQTSTIASREAGLARMHTFQSGMGSAYARSRNFDFGPDNRTNVSVLSPYTRHRLVLEEELVACALKQHSTSSSEKFVQEVIWRSYWKGWLEQRPDVWTDWLIDLQADQSALEKHRDLRVRHEEAINGQTGLDCFDFWAQELVATGYLHNHARMWFASIWVHTLDLPWSLGAAFFLKHLLDGDPATNTLSWRWICGLHTKGKSYLARADNIEKFTGKRFSPPQHSLAPQPKWFDLDAMEHAPVEREPLPFFMAPQSDVPAALVITVEDCFAEQGLLSPRVAKALTGVCTVAVPANPAEVGASEAVADFKAGSLDDAAQRFEQANGVAVSRLTDVSHIAEWFGSTGAEQLIHAHIPVGETRSALTPALAALQRDGAVVTPVAREWDKAIWPHATAGFFKVKKKIPSILAQLGLN